MALSLEDHRPAIPLAPLVYRNERVAEPLSRSDELFNNSEQSSRERVYNDAYNAERSTIPQADRGKEAWLFLTGCFCVEALLWGEFFHAMLCPFICIVSLHKTNAEELKGFLFPTVSSETTSSITIPSPAQMRTLLSSEPSRVESCISDPSLSLWL